MKMEQTECSKTSAYKLQKPGNYPKESIQHREHGESLKSRILSVCYSQQLDTSVYILSNIRVQILYFIMLVGVYGFETWSYLLREECRLREFENRVLRRIFGPKRDKATGDWRKLNNE